ncbi:type II secretion system protein GspD [Vibrio sp. WXL103]|uniref:type II secretion system protein GspD n=1 Tax=unclassified Vibrio TaxID=2614977 RepID=UPI003EC6A72E
MKKLILSGLCFLAVLLGCASQEYEDNLVANQEVSQTIADYTEAAHNPKVSYITKPPIEITPVRQAYDRAWMHETLTINAVNRPLAIVIEEVMDGTGVPIFFAEDIKPNLGVTLNFSGNRGNVLNLIARETGYGVEINNERLEISRSITRVFTLNIPTGEMTGQLGSQGNATGKDEVRIEGQYLNVKFDKVQVIKEVADTIRNVIKTETDEHSSVTESGNTATVIVRTTADKMKMVEDIIDHYQDQLSKQVLLDIQIIEFESNLGTERGVDWNIVRETGQGFLQFFLPGTNTVSQSAGYGLAFTGTGKWDGTEAFVKVLEKQGSVSTQTPVTAMVLNNQPAKITQQRLVPFIYEASSESSEGVVSASVTRSEEAEGIDMMVVTNVQPDYVWLRISGQLQKIVAEETKQVQQIDLGFLTRQKSEITFVNKLRYGQTYVIASVKQTSRVTERTESFWLPWLGGTGSKNTTIETLVLLTPRKAQ